MFLMFMWLCTCIAGNVMQGELTFASTSLSASLNDSATTVYVKSTSGFPDSGIIQIENERIAYSGKSSTTFDGSLVQPLVRGTQSTVAASHATGKRVSTIEGAMMNNSASYNIAVMSDPSGIMAFVSVPLALLQLLGSFIFLPWQFLGTDLQILTYFWAIFGIGTLVVIAINVVGSRRV